MDISTAVVTLATIPAILALVQLAKSFGVQGKWAAVLAVVLGVSLSIGDLYLGALPAYQAAASGLLLGLGAAGVYDITQLAGARTSGEVDVK